MPPPAAAVYYRTVVASTYVVVHVQRRKFHPIVLHPERRFNVVEDVVSTTGSTAHNIAADVLVNNRTQTKTTKTLLIHILLLCIELRYSTTLSHRSVAR